nr:type IV secretion system DNA-binding domain-containing protein [Corynebacterium meridianum]
MQLSGLRIAETSCSPEAITWYAVRTSELERLIPLATASEGTITPGVRVGASPVIPFQPGPKSSDAAPRQHREEVDSSGTIASDLRIGAAPTTIYGSDGPLHDVRIEPVERLRHLHILGQTGTGKSSLIADLAHQISDSDEGMIILDPHGSLVERVAKELSPVARQRTWLIRCGDTDAPVPLNPLATDDPIEREKAIASVCDMFQYLFGSKEYMVVGPRFKERVAMGIRMLYGIHGSLASLVDVPEILSDSQKIKELARETTDSRVKVWARSESAACRSSDHGELVQWVNSKFEEFNGSAHVRGILGSGLDSFDAAQAMDEGRIILIDLSTATLGEQAARLLGYMYLSKIWLGALQRTNTRTFSVIVDEAHLLTAGSLVSMLSEGRKFGLSVILAHQYLDQLSDDLAAAVAGNVGTVIAMRQALKDAHTTAARVGELTVANYLTRQADLTALVNRTAAVPQSKPHTLFVDYNDRAIGFDNDLEALVTSTCRDLGIAVK